MNVTNVSERHLPKYSSEAEFAEATLVANLVCILFRLAYDMRQQWTLPVRMLFAGSISYRNKDVNRDPCA